MTRSSSPSSVPPTIRSSFQFKLFLLFTLLTASITAILVTLFVATEIREHDRHASEQLQLLTVTFANSIRLPLYAENLQLLEGYAKEALRLPEIRVVEIYDANGALLVRAPEKAPVDHTRFMVKSVEIRGSFLPILPETLVEGSSRGALVGRVLMYRGTDDLWANTRHLIVSACALALLSWLLVSGSCYLLLRRVTRSFQALMRGLEQVRGGDYVSPIEVLSDDEPGRASAAVIELAASLRQRDEENTRLHGELLSAMRLEMSSNERLAALNHVLEEEVAERNRARQELKNLVEQLPVGIVWSTADGTVEYLNRFMLERIGYGRDEVRTVQELWNLACPEPAARQRVWDLRSKAIVQWTQGARDISFYDVQVVCKDGSRRDLTCSNQLSGSRTVDIIIDMTERELLQQQLIRNQKLESMGVLAGGIAHNFNNALTGVIGYISFAKKYIDRSHGAHELLQYAERASKRAAGLASQLLTFAKGGAPVRRVVSVSKLVEESVSLATTGSTVASRVELPPSLYLVLADDNQICQAFNCICLNAVQAMPEGGVLTVRGRNASSKEETLPVPQEGEYVELSFRDEGCGISEKDKPYIFTPYFTTKAQVGTGLGLATAHSIITRHGGAINFVSAQGEGTTFTLYLPALPGVERESISEEEQERVHPLVRGASILVMDDEEIIRSLARDVLEGQGFRVTLCSSGEEAASLYREALEEGHPYHVAILDLTVPGGMGGRETAQKILALDANARLIVSSGYSNDAVMDAYRDYGFCAAYPKPYDAQTLTRLLGRLGLAA